MLVQFDTEYLIFSVTSIEIPRDSVPIYRV
jgi:hypothetical protein